MKTAISPSLLLAILFIASPLYAQTASPFANFKGDFLRHGTVAISDGAATTNGDKVKMRFKIASTGERARLKISGIVHLEGAIRPFSALYIFKSTGIAAISNLAPAIDDGHAAEGTYTVFPRKITAETPFTFGTTAGKGTIQLRLKKRPHGLQLLVVQALSSNALVKPISWKFAAVSRR